jgi:monoamine oxidase
MSRTPIFAALQRSLRLARAANRSDRPTAELVEASHAAAATRRAERRAERLGRRDFLVLTGAAAGAAACAPAVGRGGGSGGREEEPVIIIGAGIAGLSAAWRLRRAGVPVRLYEAQERTGGRMFSLRGHFAEGQVAELGGELIDTGHSGIRALALELGVPLDDLTLDDPALGRSLWHFGGAARSEAEVVEAFRPLAARIDADLAAAAAGADITFRTPGRAQAVDRLSIAEWLERAGAGGWVRRLVEVGYTTEFGLEPDEQSALNLLTMIGTGDPFEIFGESDERFHVRGGNDLLVQGLAERVRDAIHPGTRLEAIRTRSDGRFECSLRRGAGSFTAASPHVVLALPFTLLRDVALDVELPAPKRRAIAELGYGTNAKLMAGFSARPWRAAHRSNGSVLADLPFQLTWETSRLQAGNGGILTNFTGGRHGVELGRGTAAEQAGALVAGLEAVFPGIAAARQGMTEARFHWPSHPFTRGSYASYRPGQWTGMRGVEGEPVGRLFFAGEHCSLAAQGFMEGGYETGCAAAAGVLAARGRRLPAAG